MDTEIGQQLHFWLEAALEALLSACAAVNARCSGLSPVQLILLTTGLTLLASYMYNVVYGHVKPFRQRVRETFFRHVKRLPFIREAVAKQVDSTVASMQNQFIEQNKGIPFVRSLPRRGLCRDELMHRIAKYKEMDTVRWQNGMVSGTVYHGEDDLTMLMTEVYSHFAWTNPLHPDVFPDIRKMESEVVRMCCSMYQGGPQTCGALTSGGTESILLACKAYRDLAYERGISLPEMVIPVTAHAAFDKAGDYFRIKVVHVPLDGRTMKVDLKAMKAAITRNTCMLVASSPQYPNGVIDPVQKVAALGKRYNIPVHMDCCLGGFIVPFLRKAGFDVDTADFTTPGLTSISADTHKYGFAPKGSSVILYSDHKYLQKQFFCQPDWPGGIYASPTLAGSRAGAISAVCWATLMHIGEEGYIESTRKIVSTQRYIMKGLQQIEGIFVYGEPEASVVSFGSLDFNIYRVTDAMVSRGWNLNSLQFPPSIHLCVTLPHTKPGAADRFLRELQEVVTEIMRNPNEKVGGAGVIYGMAASIPDRSLVSDLALSFISCCLDTEIGRPQSNGTVH